MNSSLKVDSGATKIFGRSIPPGVIYNLFSMYGIYCSTYLLAVVTVPYLTRTLGPATWGALAVVQAFAACLGLAVDFGFTFSGTRDAARVRDDRQSLKEVLSAVQGAKLLLALLGCGVALVVEHYLPLFREHAAAFWWSVLWAVLQGLNLMWFFQGIERMQLVAILDFIARVLAVVATFAFVKGPADMWLVLAFQAGASLLSLLVSVVLAGKAAGFTVPPSGSVTKALRCSVRTFIPRNASSFFTTGNTFLLGFFVRPELVGFYGGADRICRAIVGLLAPASEAVYPRITNVAIHSRKRALHLARLGALVIVSGSLVMAVATYALAPMLVRVLLGPGYDSAVTPLRILTILLPTIAFRNVIAIHWMLPLDLEGELNLVVLACGVLNLVLAMLIVPRYGVIGMAWVVVVSQVFASVAAWLVLRWMELDPFSGTPPPDIPSGACEESLTEEPVAP